MNDSQSRETLLIEHLSNKLCHDLAGSIGAIANSIDFLNDNMLREKAEDLLTQTSKQLMDQIQFFRKLYGYIDVTMVGEIHKLLELAKNYLSHRKIHLIFNNDELQKNNTINGLDSKVIINIIYLCANCLISGGNMELTLLDKDSISLLLKGQILKFDQLIEDILLNAKPSVLLDTKTAQAIYTSKLIAQAKNLRFSLEEKQDNQIIFKLTKF